MDDGAGIAESRQLVARVESLSLVAVPEEFRTDEIRLTVHPRAEGLPPSHYLRAPVDAAHGRDLVAAVSLGIFDSPDEVQVLEARLDGHRLALRVRIRKFQGPLAANVQVLALVTIDLKDLSPGRYHVEIEVERFLFTKYEHPETATFESSSSHRLSMDIRA